MKAGDTVKHKPTGEKWLVMAVDNANGSLMPCGWPETIAWQRDCIVLDVCSESEQRAMLDRAIASGENRAAWARRELATLPETGGGK